MATKMPVVICFDSGNIEAAMHAVRGRIPDADKIVCADNDLVTPERAANSLNGVMREKLGYPRIRPEDIDGALANGGKVELAGGEGFELRVREVAESSHYDVPRLYPEIWRDGERVHKIVVNNAGMEKALAAAAAEGAKVVAPNFMDTHAHSKGHKDYNDLHVTEGLDSVRLQLASVIDLVKGRQFAEERARELKYNLIEVRPVENDARHVGQIVLHAGCHAVQETGRNTAVAHAYKDLDRIPVEGQMTRIEYKGGRGTVADLNSQEKLQGRGR